MSESDVAFWLFLILGLPAIFIFWPRMVCANTKRRVWWGHYWGLLRIGVPGPQAKDSADRAIEDCQFCDGSNCALWRESIRQ